MPLPVGDDYCPISFEHAPMRFKLDEEGKIVAEGGRILPGVVIIFDNHPWIVAVDLNKGEVYRILDEMPRATDEAPKQVRLEGPPIPPITEGEKGEAIKIAKADPRVRKLLDKGAEIEMVSGRWHVSGVIEKDEKIKVTTTTKEGVDVVLKLPGVALRTTVEVDLVEGRVTRITPEPCPNS